MGPFGHLTAWLTFNLGLPLLQVGILVLIRFLTGASLKPEDVLGGEVLLFTAMGLLAGTLYTLIRDKRLTLDKAKVRLLLTTFVVGGVVLLVTAAMYTVDVLHQANAIQGIQVIPDRSWVVQYATFFLVLGYSLSVEMAYSK